MSRSGSGYWIWFLEGVEPLIHGESGSANFGAKLVLSLNGTVLSFMNSVAGSVCRAKCLNILQDNFYIELSRLQFIRFAVNI